ncbi:MAG TPA: hypothetical protein VFA55_10095 [Candidatus Kapabacteria bacterium]|nr:hypothetical protein [Candidatus Kapabacteria bacterium]
MKKIFLSLLCAGIGAGMLFLAGCNSSNPVVSSIYSVAYHAGPVINKDYSQSYVVTSREMAYDTTAKDSVRLYKFTGIGRCSCGAETDQTYLLCDSTGKPLYAPGDSGSFGMKILGDETEPFIHGNVQVLTFTQNIDNITMTFVGYVWDGTDSVVITSGKIIAPTQ